jgi:murein DD-endopeptidase MepM/ murein hydrolase activator NlpD
MPNHPDLRRGSAALAAAAVFAAFGPAAGASAHTVTSGESFWSIAVANGVSPETLATANGRSLTSTIMPGDTLYVPASAYGSTYGTTTPTYSTTAPTYSTTSATAAASPSSATAAGMVPVSGPMGTAYLPPSAAQNLQSLRQASQQQMGVDVYPAGPLSGYRTYAQQAELYREYLAGQGPLAAVPGTSEHETGRALDVGSMSGRQAVDELGAPYGWVKLEAPTEWWHVSYTGP